MGAFARRFCRAGIVGSTDLAGSLEPGDGSGEFYEGGLQPGESGSWSEWLLRLDSGESDRTSGVLFGGL